jgi:hypothetical protein
MNSTNLENAINSKLCQICEISESGYNYVKVSNNRSINSCFECHLTALKWLEKECIVCKKWIFECRPETFEKTCSLNCEQKLQDSLERERIVYGKYRDKK